MEPQPLPIPVVEAVEAVPVEAPIPVPVVEAPVHHEPTGPRTYASLYDSQATTVAAILFGVLIVGGIQFIVARMYQHAKNEQEYLTRFVTALVALVMGAYIADLLIAGPDTSLLSPEEHLTILGFVKDVCLMVFAYFFGTKSAAPTPPQEST
jgi:hypothetical protein